VSRGWGFSVNTEVFARRGPRRWYCRRLMNQGGGINGMVYHGLDDTLHCSFIHLLSFIFHTHQINIHVIPGLHLWDMSRPSLVSRYAYIQSTER
jgi:hypothetical protein